MPIFLGIDGGGTKTVCAVGDASRVLSLGHGAGSNIVRSGEAQARISLHQAIRSACADAGVTPSAIDGVCIGASGAGRPEVRLQVERIAAELLTCPVQVVGDTVIALNAAFGAGPGVITIAGTGSIAYGRNSSDAIARAGGWGLAISDEGSGQWIGRTSITRALRGYDEGQESSLLIKILQDWAIASHQDLVRTANASPPPDFCMLFPVVLSAADAGEPEARAILTDAGAELAALARIVLHRLFPGAQTPVPMAMVGGVFRQSALVRQVFYNQIRAAFPLVLMNPTVVEPVLGALDLARKATAGKALDASEIAHMP